MFQRLVLGAFLVLFSGLSAQEIETPYKKKKIVVTNDTISLEKVSINKAFFKLLDAQGNPIDTINYHIDFQKGTLKFKNNFTSNDTLIVRYLTFPDYLTKTYQIYDDSKVVPNARGNGQLYSLSKERINNFKPFDGLNTSGSITRGVTVGSNQNAVVNSNLDLQISGKLSDKVSLRASIQDSNIPLQEGGYSQKLDEFDQIFIEIAGEHWTIRAGDLFLENRQSRYLNFNKKVQGISTQFQFGKEGNKTSVFASGALVRGQYAKSTFTGKEGNQGPYKLRGINGEAFVLVISGSERVFVNGLLVTRGENNQYTIDYNAGEVTFTSLFPITSEMRISIEYQFADRNFTRFITYGGVMHEREKFSIGGFVYSENDVKNQPLQQNLSKEQVDILEEAGDDQTKMIAPSAFLDSFSENKILYRKILVTGVEVYEFSTDEEEELYNVRFTLVGNNQGNYLLVNSQAIGRIFEYVAPIGGIPQGNYEPIIRLVTPTKIQIATVMGKFNPSEKTLIDFELGLSTNDLNLYSSLDDENNQGVAGRFNGTQRLFSKKGTLDAFANYQFVQADFRTIERLFAIEFNRDWNLPAVTEGNQSLLVSGLKWNSIEKGFAIYQFEKLDFSATYSGFRHLLDGRYKHQNWTVVHASSFMKSEGTFSNSSFLRSNSQVKYHFKKNWVGGTFQMENNEEKINETQSLSQLSQRFSEVGSFIGRGDSTKVFVEVGYLHRINDSLQNGVVQRVNRSNSYYLNSRLLQTEKSDLSVFINYRNLVFEDPSRENAPSINSRILYNDRYFNQLLQLTTIYETAAGTLPQQEFTYLEVEPGQGVFMWNDYNNNGIQELAEFEIAPFPDQAKYVRVFLPNQLFVNTFQTKFSLALTFNPMQWQNKSGFQKFLSYFYNQTSFLIDQKTFRDDSFNLNPFATDEEALLGLNNSFMNSFFYNRGKQKHSTTYTFVRSRTQNLLSLGLQQAMNQSHQLQYNHLIKKSWLLTVNSRTILSESEIENYENRNFEIKGYLVAPKISYLFSKNTSLDFFYEYQTKENQFGLFETLTQNRLGTAFTYAGEKQFTMNGEFSLYENTFDGDALSAVGFQMLEGLQPGRNTTWRLLVQKTLTSFLDINVNYQGRKSETSDTIHTGNIQLRAYF
jgi:hypothetical protein